MTRINAFLLSYNHPEHTLRAAQSLLKMKMFEKYYLIHNGSQEKHIRCLQDQLPSFEHILMPENKGYSGGMNRAFEILCSTDGWGFFLTNDCTLEFLEGPPKTKGFWAPTIFFRKMGRIDSLGGSFFPQKGLLAHRKALPSQGTPDGHERFYIPGSAFWLDSESARQGGFFESKLGTYWEDVDLSQRYQAMKIPVGYDANTQVLHRGGKTCHKDPMYTLYFYQRIIFL
jgi:GT2 family glycosyltransferase